MHKLDRIVSKNIHDIYTTQRVTGNSNIEGCKKLGGKVDQMMNILCGMSIHIFSSNTLK